MAVMPGPPALLRLAALPCLLRAACFRRAPAVAQDRRGRAGGGDRLVSRRRSPRPSRTWSPRPTPMRSRPAWKCCAPGGSAADAAVAVQLVLNLVEPQSSGIGGGAFVLHWDAARKRLEDLRRARDGAGGRQARPVPGRRPAAHVRRGRLRRPERRRARHAARARSRAQAARPAAVGAPVRAGHPAGRATASGSRRACICCCAGTARESFAPRGAALLLRHAPAAPARPAICSGTPSSRRPCAPSPSAARRPSTRAPIAEAIVEAVREAAQPPGRHDRWPISPAIASRSASPSASPTARYRVCGMGPPSSGGLAVAQVLKLIEPFELGQGPGRRHERARRCISSPRPRSSPSPTATPTSAIPISCRRPPACSNAGYLDCAARAHRSGHRHGPAGGRHAAADGEPRSRRRRDRRGGRHQPFLHRRRRRQRARHDHHHRGRRSARGCGRRASCSTTSSPTSPSGPSTAPAGRSPTRWGRASGRAARWRRPSCSTRQGKPWAALGSPGGSRIILYVVKALVALIDWKLDAQAAAALMNFGSRGGAVRDRD